MLRYPGTPFLNPSIKIFHSENLEWFLLPTQIFFIFVGFSLLLSTFQISVFGSVVNGSPLKRMNNHQLMMLYGGLTQLIPYQYFS